MTPHTVMAAILAWVGFASTARGQACAPTTDSVAVFLRVSMRQLAASTNAEWAAARVAYQVPNVDSTTIVSVTQNQTCQKLLGAFNAAVPISPAPTRIYAVSPPNDAGPTGGTSAPRSPRARRAPISR